MPDPTSRALSLLNLLQTHQHWPGRELAERLNVTERTVRRDVERLRDLGYRIDSVPGTAGGYRLEAGSAVPPLLLTDDEAVAMAVGLRLAASRRLVGGPETSLTALAKLEQVLPAPLRRRVNALAETVRPAGIRTGRAASTEVLGRLALACRDHERVRFCHTSPAGAVTDRLVEPHYLVPAERHWYLLCWDLRRDDWRTFRVDRLTGIQPTGVRFVPHALAPEEIEEFVLAARSTARHTVEARVVMEMPLREMRACFGPWARGAEAAGPGRSSWEIGGDEWREVLFALSWIPVGVEYVIDLPEPARGELRETLTRMLRALDAPGPPADRPQESG